MLDLTTRPVAGALRQPASAICAGSHAAAAVPDIHEDLCAWSRAAVRESVGLSVHILLPLHCEGRGAAPLLETKCRNAPSEHRRVCLACLTGPKETSTQRILLLGSLVGLKATALVGVSEVGFQRGAERAGLPREWFGGRRVRYRHYHGEFSRKPQALHQVDPELNDELGGPYDRQLQAAAENGEERVRVALEASLAEGGFDESAIHRSLAASQAPDEVTVPQRLRGCRVERASVTDYDRLLERGAS